VKALSYIGFRSPNAEAWTTFGPEVLGAELADPGPDGAVRLRVDEAVARIAIHPGEREEHAYFGWDVGDGAGLDEVAERVRRAGIAVDADAAARAARQVDDLLVFVDPFGFRHELTHGLAEAGPFVPGRPISGFMTGDGGLGHAVLIVPDLERGLAFYRDVLGFKVSDTIDTGAHLVFLHCNPRHHTLALAEARGLVGVHHLMLELRSMDDVGTGLDLVQERGIPLAMGLGRHTNDLMTSFYVRTPSGFEIEYGTGGIVVDDDTWTTGTHASGSRWGHHPPATGPLRPKILRPVGQPT